jgi:hypothetical protein
MPRRAWADGLSGQSILTEQQHFLPTRGVKPQGKFEASDGMWIARRADATSGMPVSQLFRTAKP